MCVCWEFGALQLLIVVPLLDFLWSSFTCERLVGCFNSMCHFKFVAGVSDVQTVIFSPWRDIRDFLCWNLYRFVHRVLWVFIQTALSCTCSCIVWFASTRHQTHAIITACHTVIKTLFFFTTLIFSGIICKRIQSVHCSPENEQVQGKVLTCTTC